MIPAIPAKEKEELVEGQPDDFVRLSCRVGGVLIYFAAREGYLGKKLQKISVEMVKEKPPEKPKEQAQAGTAEGGGAENGGAAQDARRRR